MTTPILTDEITIQQIAFRLGCRAEGVHDALDMPDYPADLLAARRIAFLRQIEAHPLEARLAAIDAALGELTDPETVNNLLEEKAEILIQLGKE